MKTHSRRRTSLALCLVVGGAALAASVAVIPEAAAKERRIATLAPPGSRWMKELEKASEEINKATSGRVTMKYYPGGVQGDERDVVRKMKLGQLDGAALTGTGLSLIDESIRVLELPMMFKDVSELDCVRRKMWGSFQSRFAKKGFQLGEPGDVGFIHFYSSKPVTSIADLKSQKIWMWTDDLVVRAMYKKLGISGVPLGVPDVLPSLQTGRINAAYASPLAAVALQWNKKVKYMTSMPLTYAIGASVVNKKAWDEASAEDREAINKILKKTGSRIRKNVRKDNGKAKTAMVRGGVKEIQTPPALIADFDKAAQEVWKELVGKVYSQGQLDTVLKHRASCRK